MTKLTVKPNECSTYVIEVTFLGVDSVGFTPATCIWSLSTPTGTIVNLRNRVSESVISGVHNFVLTGDDLTYDVGSGDGIRVFTVEGTYDSDYGTGLPFREQVQFTVLDTVLNAL